MDIGQNMSFVLGAIALLIGVACFIATAFKLSKGWGWAVVLSAGILWPVHLMRSWENASLWFLCIVGGLYALYLSGVFGV